MEARQAAQAVRLVETTSRMIRSPIAYTLLFARTNAAFLTTDEREVRQEMEANNINTLPVRIARRAPYTRIFRDNLLLAELPDLVAKEMKGGPVAVSFRSGAHVKRSSVQMPRGFPKGTDLSQHRRDELDAVAYTLNSRPRKTLGWKTPTEALDEILS